jgi:hypothetical protein
MQNTLHLLHALHEFKFPFPSLHSIRALITSAVHDIPDPCLLMVCPLPRPTSYQFPSTCSTCCFGFLPSDADVAVHDAAASLKQQLQRIQSLLNNIALLASHQRLQFFQLVYTSSTSSVYLMPVYRFLLEHTSARAFLLCTSRDASAGRPKAFTR